MIGRCINCSTASTVQPLLDTPPQRGVISESRGSFWIRFWPQGLVSRQATAMQPVWFWYPFCCSTGSRGQQQEESSADHLGCKIAGPLFSPAFETFLQQHTNVKRPRRMFSISWDPNIVIYMKVDTIRMWFETTEVIMIHVHGDNSKDIHYPYPACKDSISRGCQCIYS